MRSNIIAKELLNLQDRLEKLCIEVDIYTNGSWHGLQALKQERNDIEQLITLMKRYINY